MTSLHRPLRALRLPVAAVALGTLIAGVGLAAASAPAQAVAVAVTTQADISDSPGCAVGNPDPGPDGFWSLREAVCLANALNGPDTIVLPAGTYTLTAPLVITDQVSITGAGMGATTIDASATEKAIDAYSFSGIDLDLAQLTIIGGETGTAEGGGISTFLVNTNLHSVRITGGVAGNGGGISSIYGTLTTLDSVIDGNTATGTGGGVFIVGELRMQRTTVSGNSALMGGGLVLESSGSEISTVEQSTISGNTASGNGAGIALDSAHQGQTVITDTTIVGNATTGSGGAVYSAGSGVGELLLSSTTVTGNEASVGGGIAQTSGMSNVQHSIVAENSGGDLSGAVGGSGNIVGIAGGSIVDGVNGNVAGTAGNPLDPQLRALGQFGGPTETRVPLPDSPAIDTALSCGAVDQRGESRPAGTGCDIGAVELTAAPDTTIVTGPASHIASGAATFDVSASAGSGPYTFECDLDASGTFAACPSGISFSGLLDGSHTLAVRAVDALGATDPNAASHAWTVDLTAPVIAWGAVSLGTAPGDISTFAFSATDASGIAGFECSLDGSGFAACTSPVATSSLAAGVHSFRVRASDSVGNVSEVAEQSWTVARASSDGSAPAGGSTPTSAMIAKTGGESLGAISAVALSLLVAGSLTLATRLRRRADC